MLFSAFTAVLLSSACSAAVVPRQDNGTSSASQKFVVHSRPCPATYGFDGSLGYLHAEYSYPPGYSATLHTDKADAITGYITDLSNPSDSSLEFDGQGFKLYPLSEQYPNSLAQIFSGQTGTTGMTIEGDLLKWEAPDNVPVSWFACPTWALEWGATTALFYKWANTTTTEGCQDVDLVVEYV